MRRLKSLSASDATAIMPTKRLPPPRRGNPTAPRRPSTPLLVGIGWVS